MAKVFLMMTLLFAVVNSQCNVTFSTHPQSVAARIGDRVNFTCDIAEDKFLARSFIQYRTNGTIAFEITVNEEATLNRGFMRMLDVDGTPNTLIIPQVRAEHAGIYACSAIPDLRPCDGSVTIYTMNATLSIIGPPTITPPASLVFNVPTTTDLKASILITGTSPTSQVFQIEDSGNLVEISAATHPRIQSTFMGTQFQLTISDVRRSDAGQYMIIASNDFGSDNITITVEPVGPDRPVVNTTEVFVSRYGDSVNLICSIQDDGVDSSVTFTWTNKNNVTILPGSTYSIDSTTSSSILTINSLTRNLTGTYTCFARNVRDGDSQTILVFGPPPSITSNPRINGTGRSRTVTWNRPATAEQAEPITKYEVTLYIMGTDMVIREGKIVDVLQSHTTAQYTFRDLEPNSYEVRLASISVVGNQLVKGDEGPAGSFVVDEDNEVHVVAIAVGAVAGVAILVAIGAAIGIFFFCFYYPHRRQLQSQQQTWSREDVKTDGAVQNEYSSLTLRPNSDYPLSPGMTSPTSSQFLAQIDPKWEFPRENIKLSDALCEGQFTVLYRGIATGIKEKPVDIAVKTVRDDATEDDVKALMAEMEMLSSIGPHENIVSMIRVCTVGKPMYMVMEYMCHGDLLGFLRASRGHHGRYTVSPGLGYQPPAINLYPRDLLNIGAKIANGMRYLADRKLVHRALCAKNVLVGSNMSIKIYNVGSFDMTFESRDYIMKWLAPETLFDQTATTYSDVWSFGVALWELVTVGGTPYGEIQPEDLYSQLMNGMRMPCPQHCAQEIHDLMLDCWQRNPVDRPHFSVIHERLEDLAASKINLLDFQNYDVFVYSQFEEPVALSTVL